MATDGTELAADHEWVDRYLDDLWLQRGLSEHTLSSYRSDLEQLSRRRGPNTRLIATRRSDLLAFLSERYQQRYSPKSTARMLSTLRGFYRYLLEQRIIDADPTLGIHNPKLGRPLPGSLTETEIEALITAPDTSTALGVRDRTMLETIYSCGLRVSELINLEIQRINLRQGALLALGKGNKERLVPLGENALAWLQGFIRVERRELLRGQPSDTLFPGRRGQPMTRQNFWYLIKKYALAADIRRPISPHTLRHAFATHLVNHDADLRVVQMLLGHASLSSTQIYTHVARQRLQDLHSQHHPRG